MELSIIIVNYNVKLFLEQCLYSVRKAINGIGAEVIIVDNHSGDNSVEYLSSRFPSFRFITNTENRGFAKACNQGKDLAKGKYILFLNPDTIVPEDCFRKCISFFESHPDAGALGIKMLDGSGKFLQESKRSFPLPLTSLYKLFGLSQLFPHSKQFSKYHLGNLDKNKNHEIDVMAGAFMMVKSEVLERTGGFDEAFFMYGEDIDLSYRIQKSTRPGTDENYRNYYFAESSIIHFKGESTRKGSLNYVRMFYTAMNIFVRKHYGGGKAGSLIFLVQTAILVRAIMAAIGNFIRKVGLPLIDAGLILLSFWLMKNIWNQYVRTNIQYENKLLLIAFPVFTVVYLITAYYAGLYDRWYKRSELVRSTIIATFVLLAGYALLPEEYRFSRGIVLFGALLVFLLISLLRWVLVQTRVLDSNKKKKEHANTLIVASAPEYEKVMQLMKVAGLQERVLGRVAVDINDVSGIGGGIEIQKLSRSIPFREIIFCEDGLSFAKIIESIEQLPKGYRLKFHAAGSSSVVGSDSKDSSGESVSKENGFKLSDPYNRRIKRLIDVSFSLLSLITFPIHLFGVKKPIPFFASCFAVLFGKKSWVGYALPEKNLPTLRKGVIACNGIRVSTEQQLPKESLQIMDEWYARDYEPATDLRLIWKTYRRLGG